MHRFLTFLSVALLTAVPFTALAEDPTGTWNIVCEGTGVGTCKDSVAGKTAYQWIVSTTDRGEVTISVVGKTSYPEMTGTFNPELGRIVADGKSTTKTFNCSGQYGDCEGIHSTATVVLDVESSGRLKGKRYFSTIEPKKEASTPKKVIMRPCMVELECEGKKQ